MVLLNFYQYFLCDSVRKIEVFDTAVAFLAGLMIVPSVFAFSGESKEALGIIKV